VNYCRGVTFESLDVFCLITDLLITDYWGREAVTQGDR
jgi:hypothetical protein